MKTTKTQSALRLVHFRIGWLSLLLASCFAAGCSVAKAPLYLAEDFSTAAPSRIAVLPVLDQRSDRTDSINLEQIRKSLKTALAKKGYSAEEASFGNGISAEAAAELHDADFATLVPSNFEAAALFSVDDLRKGWGLMIIAPTYEFEMKATARLIHGKRGLLWFDEGSHVDRGGGVLGSLQSLGTSEINGYSSCVKDTLSSLPAKGK